MALVLVVDDEPDARLLARVVLTRVGHVVVERGDGRSALDRVQTEPRPDVLVLDIRMPGLDGWQVIERLPPDGPPVLVVTADEAALEQGHPMVLVKPYRPEELVAAVAHALDGAAER